MADPTYISPLRLRVDLGNAFSAGLYRLAVMSQPADGATDLGQSLPTGLLDGVSCSPPRAGSGGSNTEITHCSVRWRTQGGDPRQTKYRIRMYGDGCFDAAARPSLPPHIDPTVEGYSEHPLNVLVGAENGCS
ncbi:MAG TPA: hypothetical protein VN522_12515 [Solirubrobacterales bacterium]|nr:hypothetical protein [Solirubrobacterales bacterium]